MWSKIFPEMTVWSPECCSGDADNRQVTYRYILSMEMDLDPFAKEEQRGRIMFDKLEDLLIRYEELMSELSEPDVANNPERFRKLMKEQSDILPIVEAYKEYKQCKQNIEDSLAMLEEESDEEMRELAKEELNESKNRVTELENELKILLLPKDPNDDKNVIVEIRAGAG